MASPNGALFFCPSGSKQWIWVGKSKRLWLVSDDFLKDPASSDTQNPYGWGKEAKLLGLVNPKLFWTSLPQTCQIWSI